MESVWKMWGLRKFRWSRRAAKERGSLSRAAFRTVPRVELEFEFTGDLSRWCIGNEGLITHGKFDSVPGCGTTRNCVRPAELSRSCGFRGESYPESKKFPRSTTRRVPEWKVPTIFFPPFPIKLIFRSRHCPPWRVSYPPPSRFPFATFHDREISARSDILRSPDI